MIPAVVDFETEGITPRPDYPPRPVGVAVWEPSRKPRYLAWGHPAGNNCDRADAIRRLRGLWRGRRPLLFHNAKFDLDVAETHLGLPSTPAGGFHDTLFLAFLDDPYAKQLSLKPLAESRLGLPPDERDELRDWILANVPAAKRAPTTWGAYIAKAPGGLVGRYAVGDARRTRGVFELLHPDVCGRGMRAAYERELALVPVLLRAERRGVPVRVNKLRRDHEQWRDARIAVDRWLCRRLGIDEPSDWYVKGRFKSPIDRRSELADGLERVGAVEEWILTARAGAGGEDRSTAMDALAEVMAETDAGRRLLPVLRFRSVLNYATNYAAGWLRGADDKGRMYTQWNQVRQEGEYQRGLFGARTGRLSSTPNLQNVIQRPAPVAYGRDPAEPGALRLPAALRACGQLPALRDYVRAPRGQTLLQRDYSQQELRILAHFAGGELLDAYLRDPQLDQHQYAQVGINRMLGTSFERRPIKNTGFGLIYGLGLGRLAESIGAEVAVARTLKSAYLDMFPGLKELISRLRECAYAGKPITTWAGREYLCEEPKFKDGRLWTFEYKLINYKVQGSAGDNTKQAILNLDEALRESEFLVTVHDEFIAQSPHGAEHDEMSRFREALLDVDFLPPMLSDGKVGASWGRLRKYTDRPDEWWYKTKYVEPWRPRKSL